MDTQLSHDRDLELILEFVNLSSKTSAPLLGETLLLKGTRLTVQNDRHTLAKWTFSRKGPKLLIYPAVSPTLHTLLTTLCIYAQMKGINPCRLKGQHIVYRKGS